MSSLGAPWWKGVACTSSQISTNDRRVLAGVNRALIADPPGVCDVREQALQVVLVSRAAAAHPIVEREPTFALPAPRVHLSNRVGEGFLFEVD